MERKNAWKSYSEKDEKAIEKLCDGYKDYLFNGKTEREGVKFIIEKAKAAGYISLEDAISKKKKLKAGDKIYAVCMGKTVALFNIGKKNLEEGMNILGAHLDSPRLDVKQNPLYENNELAYLDTHYYGGIKKYQWVTLPLAIHGVVVKTDGTVIDVVIGEDENDPVFCVTDILIHLAQDQMVKKANVAVEGEALDLLIASRPLKISGKKEKDDKKGKVSEKDLVKHPAHQIAGLLVVEIAQVHALQLVIGFRAQITHQIPSCLMRQIIAQKPEQHPQQIQRHQRRSQPADGMQAVFIHAAFHNARHSGQELGGCQIDPCQR